MAEWTCESCVHYPPSSFGGKPCWLCNTNNQLLNLYEKREEPVITNADRIRAMSDEELADLINDAEWGFLDRPGMCDVCSHRMKACLKCWLDWLRSPVGGDGT